MSEAFMGGGGGGGAPLTGTYYGTGGMGKRTINVGFRPTRLELCGVQSSGGGSTCLVLVYDNSCIEISNMGVALRLEEYRAKITDNGFEVGSATDATAPFNVVSCVYQYTAFR